MYRRVLVAVALLAMVGIPLLQAGCPRSSFSSKITVVLKIPVDPPNVVQAGAVSSFPHDVTDGTGHTWALDADGSVESSFNTGLNTADGFVGYIAFVVDAFNFNGELTADLEDGRELVYGPQNLDGMNVTRKVYVSDTDGFIRWLDIVENPTNADVVKSLTADGEFDLNQANDLVDASSNGDTTLDANDEWWATCQAASNPTMCAGHFFCSASPAKTTADFLYFYPNVTIPAQGRVIVLNIALMRSEDSGSTISPADARGQIVTELQHLEMFPCVDAKYLVGMTHAELNDLLGCGGAVEVSGASGSVDGGSQVTIENTSSGVVVVVTAAGNGSWQAAIRGDSGNTLSVSSSDGQTAMVTVP
jgi:hypothetical protein